MNILYMPYQDILLRDMILEDVDDVIAWNTTLTEWKQWDSPWENKQFDEKQYRKTMATAMQPISKIRVRLELCIRNSDQHIGWVARYILIDDFTQWKVKTAIGLSIAEVVERGKGYGKQSMCAFIAYLRKEGIEEIYTQTWSGNTRMVNLALALGFEEIHCKKNYRFVNGKEYDGLTYLLNIQKHDQMVEEVTKNASCNI